MCDKFFLKGFGQTREYEEGRDRDTTRRRTPKG